MGMHLASVHSEKEHEYIVKLAGGAAVWIGGRRKPSSRQPPESSASCKHYCGKDDWEWSDGKVNTRRPQHNPNASPHPHQTHSQARYGHL